MGKVNREQCNEQVNLGTPWDKLPTRDGRNNKSWYRKFTALPTVELYTTCSTRVFRLYNNQHEKRSSQSSCWTFEIVDEIAYYKSKKPNTCAVCHHRPSLFFLCFSSNKTKTRLVNSLSRETTAHTKNWCLVSPLFCPAILLGVNLMVVYLSYLLFLRDDGHLLLLYYTGSNLPRMPFANVTSCAVYSPSV